MPKNWGELKVRREREDTHMHTHTHTNGGGGEREREETIEWSIHILITVLGTTFIHKRPDPHTVIILKTKIFSKFRFKIFLCV